VVALSGDLGAGKTCFVQGVAEALGVKERVTSPTFVIVREHQGIVPILHMDVYRLKNLQELTDLGYEEMLDPGSVMFIEWGDALGPLLPDEYLEIEIKGGADDPRAIDFHAHGTEWNGRLASVGDTVLEWREGTA